MPSGGVSRPSPSQDTLMNRWMAQAKPGQVGSQLLPKGVFESRRFDERLIAANTFFTKLFNIPSKDNVGAKTHARQKQGLMRKRLSEAFAADHAWECPQQEEPAVHVPRETETTPTGAHAGAPIDVDAGAAKAKLSEHEMWYFHSAAAREICSKEGWDLPGELASEGREEGEKDAESLNGLGMGEDIESKMYHYR